MDYQNLRLIEPKDYIAQIVLSRPEKRNALSRALTEELHKALEALETRDDIRALVISGEGKAFAAGADIAELKDRTRADAFLGINSRLFQRLENFPWPT